MDTLLLDPNSWDITLDSSGNLAIATGDYAIAQDVASSCRLFSGELWYDTTQGIPYFQQIFGKLPPLGFLAAKFASASETVPDVETVSVTLNPITSNRELTGTISITSQTTGVTSVISATQITPWYVSAVGQQDYSVYIIPPAPSNTPLPARIQPTILGSSGIING